MTIVVTGGAGFIDSHIVDALLRERHNLLAVDNLTTGRLGNADIRDQAALEEIFQQLRPTLCGAPRRADDCCGDEAFRGVRKFAMCVLQRKN